MSPFKPSNGLSYQAPSSAIPSLDGNANDRSSALGRRLSQSSLPNIPNNNKRLSGAPQGNPKRLRRELPESTKADEQRVGLADGQGIETDRNSLIGSAPREAWEDEFIQYPEDDLVPQEDSLANRVNSENLEHLSDAPNQDSDFFNFPGELDFGNASVSLKNTDAEMGLASSPKEISNIPLDKFSLVYFLNTPLDPNASEKLLNDLSQGDFSLNFLGDSNPSLEKNAN
ncbi:Putative uncharacterized protein RRP5-2 [Mycoavidus cysteinexigens]|uniref:Uncharacterized protein n=1 Tax=Mycoavidus cysteinexigens TaxID=1553431 RepID=A0A2Z6EU36_9BURK|nr:hypothetical protein [Mycoavidus cysteinexigens]BBE08953.1 Putative uncharacterized protein RRP5-2 [Mycoavidus cysteinexigens]GLR01202.1 hypothetical protein GCM10007934_10140 [Mycoavidus cysteinexigens]